MAKADLHIHTDQGDGADSIESIFDHVASSTDLSVIALTEHDNLGVALRAREVWARRGYAFDFIPGAEITTLDGHLIALFIEEPVPSLRRLEETVEAIHAKNGVCFVPHPGNWLTRSVGPRSFRRVASRPSSGLRFDAIETASSSPGSGRHQSAAQRLADDFQVPAIGASDAHFRQLIGSAFTEFDGDSASDLRHALATGRVRPGLRPHPGWRKIGLRRAISLPLTGLRATPRALGWRRTAWSFLSRYTK